MNPMMLLKIVTLGVKLRNMAVRGAKINKAHRKGRLVGARYEEAKRLYQRDAIELGYDQTDPAGSLKRAFLNNVNALAGEVLNDPKTASFVEAIGNGLASSVSGQMSTAEALRGISKACALSESELAQNGGAIADLTCEVLSMQRNDLDDILEEVQDLDPSLRPEESVAAREDAIAHPRVVDAQVVDDDLADSVQETSEEQPVVHDDAQNDGQNPNKSKRRNH